MPNSRLLETLQRLLLATSTFSDESLPLDTVHDLLLLQIGSNLSGETYLRSANFSPLRVSAPVPVPNSMCLLLMAGGATPTPRALVVTLSALLRAAMGREAGPSP